MAALSCLTPALVGRRAQSCVALIRAVGAFHSHSSSSSAAAAASLSRRSVCTLQRSFVPTRQWGVSGNGRSSNGRLFTVKAADEGAIDSPLMSSMQAKIKESLNAQEVTVQDAYGDGRHVSIDVVAEAFEGQSRVTRQRMVYKAIWEELQSAVHAVDQLKTRTPSEAAEAGKKL